MIGSKKLVGGLSSSTYYNNAIKIMNAEIKNPHYFVFSTINFPLFDKINFRSNVTFINNDTGYKGVIENLWLMSQCNHFIIGNSSFHWWAAWLAESKNRETKVIVSDNFPNKNTIPKRWTKIKDY